MAILRMREKIQPQSHQKKMAMAMVMRSPASYHSRDLGLRPGGTTAALGLTELSELLESGGPARFMVEGGMKG